MKRKLVFGLVVSAVFCYAVLSHGADLSVEKSTLRSIHEQSSSIKAASEPMERYATTTASGTWPTSVPANAFKSDFAWFDENFTISAWRDSGDIWVGIQPTSPHAFICSSSFHFLQNGVQYDTAKLTTSAGPYQCGEVSTPSIFNLSQYSYYTNKADLSQSFTLLFISDRTYSIDITGSGSVTAPTPTAPAANECVATFNASTAIIHVPCFDLNGTRYWMDLGIHSFSPLLLDLSGAGIK